jgi:hypothetical protein
MQRLQGALAVFRSGQAGPLGGEARLSVPGQLQALRQAKRPRRRCGRLCAATPASPCKSEQQHKDDPLNVPRANPSRTAGIHHGLPLLRRPVSAIHASSFIDPSSSMLKTEAQRNGRPA